MPEPTQLERERLALENRRLDADTDRWKSELEIRREQLKLDREAASRKPWLNTTSVPLIAAVVALAGTIITHMLQSASTARQQNDTQRQKFQAELIQKAIEKAPSTQDAANNLAFLSRAGLVPDFPKIAQVVSDSRTSGQDSHSSLTIPYSATFGMSDFSEGLTVVQHVNEAPYSSIVQLVWSESESVLTQTAILVHPKILLTPMFSEIPKDARLTVVTSGGYNRTISLFQVKLLAERPSASTLAAIILPDPLAGAQPLAVGFVEDPRGPVWAAGYTRGEVLRRSSGIVHDYTEDSLSMSLPTAAGFSGAPIMLANSNNLVGVHASRMDKTAVAIRITKKIVDRLAEIRAELDGPRPAVKQ